MHEEEESLFDCESQAKYVRKKARSIALLLARHGHRKSLLRNLVRALNVIVGVGVVILTFVPSFRAVLGSNTLEIAAGIAASVLVADVVVPLLLSSQPPEMYLTYAFYTDSYATQIEQLLIEEARTQREKDVRYGKLTEILRHARLNFDDVRSKFDVLSKVEPSN